MSALVSLLESAWCLDGDDAAWIRQMLAAARPSIDHGNGLFGWVYGGGRLVERSVVAIDAGYDLEGATREIHEQAPRPMHEQTYVTGVVTLSERIGHDPASAALLKRRLAPLGIGDCLGIQGRAGGELVVLGAALPRLSPTPARLRHESRRIARHLGSALRLRRTYADESASHTNAAAVLDPEGRVHHAQGDARHPDAREQLRRAVRDRERARGRMRSTDPHSALALFRGVIEGRWSIVDRFDGDGRRFLVAYENPPEVHDIRRLTPTESKVVQLTIEGRSLKQIAYELSISSATVSTHLARVRAKSGLRSRIEWVRWFHEIAERRARPREA